MRSVRSMFTILMFCVVPIFANALAQDQPNDASRQLSETELKAKSDRLRRDLQAATLSQDMPRAVALLEQLYATDKEIHGQPHVELVRTLENLAYLAEHRRDWVASIRYRERALEQTKALMGDSNYLTANRKLALIHAQVLSRISDADRSELMRWSTMHVRAIQLKQQGKTQEAFTLTQGVLKTYERIYGRENFDFGRALHTLAGLYIDLGDDAKAEELLKQSLAISKRLVGENHPERATMLNDLASVHTSRREYHQAESLHLKAMKIKADTVGKRHPDYAASLNNLGTLYLSLADYDRAETLLREAVGIYEGSQKPTDALTLATFLGNLARLNHDLGDYRQAKSYLERARQIQGRILGKENPRYTSTVQNLEIVCTQLGEFEQAAQLRDEYKGIVERAYHDNPDFLNALHNLGVQYGAAGDDARAAEIHKKIKDFYDRDGREPDAFYATNLSNLAGVYRATRDFVRAEPLQIKANQIIRDKVGKDHPDYASTLTALGKLYHSMGEYSRAVEPWTKAAEIRESHFGKRHPKYIESINNLGELFRSMGDVKRGAAYLEEAVRIGRETYGVTHPDYATSLNNLALLHYYQEEYDRAAELWKECLQNSRRILRSTHAMRSSSQQQFMKESLRHQLDNYLGCCLKAPHLTAEGYEELLAWKGALVAQNRAIRMMSQQDDLRPAIRKLQAASARLSQLWNSRPSADASDQYQRQIAEALEDFEQAERNLGALEIGGSYTRVVGLRQIQASLPIDSVLVDFVELRRRREFAAFVVSKDSPPLLFLLGKSDRISALVERWRTGLSAGAESDIAVQLRAEVWNPFEPHVKDSKLILLSPMGVVARLPFAALPGKNANSYLLEDHQLVVVPVPRELPKLMTTNRDRDQATPGFLLVGNVDFDQAQDLAPAKSDQSGWGTQTLALHRGRAAVRSTDTEFEPLPATAKEVSAISSLVARNLPGAKMTLLEKNAATEQRVKSECKDRRFVHLATHGYFANDTLLGMKRRQDRVGIGSDSSAQLAARLNPDLLSGIVLAGANESQHNSGSKLTEDGILTSLEVQSLPLGKTELVVLSACETGLGAAAGSEGILGMQRSFQIAGARSVVSSLWKVEDAATTALMTEFYRNLLSGEMSKVESLHRAQLAMLNHYRRKSGTIERGEIPRGIARVRKPTKESSDSGARLSPLYWAPFALSGDWR